MSILLKEYGKIILYVIVGSVVLGLVVTGVQNWYELSYPDIESVTGISVEYEIDEPVILAENIEIEKKETEEAIDFTEYVIAYNDSSLMTPISIEIIGEENVDVMTQGIYQIICTATNESGNSFSKRVLVLVY